MIKKHSVFIVGKEVNEFHSELENLSNSFQVSRHR